MSFTPAWGHVRLARLPEASVVFAATCAGAHLNGLGGERWPLALLLATSNALLFSASTAFNDWHDIVEDRVNKPDRPIPSGMVSPGGALVLGTLLLAGAVGTAAAAGRVLTAAALALAAASVLYTVRAKRLPVVGHVLVALVSTYPLACWLLVVPATPLYVALVLGCVALRMGGEIVKTVEDAAGDAVAGIRSLATLHGTGFAARAGLACVTLGLAIGTVPLASPRATAVYRLLLALAATVLATAWAAALGATRRLELSGSQLVVVERAVTVLMTIALAFGLAPARG